MFKFNLGLRPLYSNDTPFNSNEVKSALFSLLNFCMLLLSICFCSPQVRAASDTNSLSKAEALAEILSWKNQNYQNLTRVDSMIKSSLAKPENELFDVTMTQLRAQRAEYLLRQKFIDRLAFQTESYYRGRHLKSFLQKSISDLATIETTSPEESNGNMWKFLSYLALAIKEVPEKDENPLAFVWGYLNQSTISSPLKPDEIANQRDYTNGEENQTANEIDSQRLGEIVEQRIREIEHQRAAAEIKKPFSDRKPHLKSTYQILELEKKPEPKLNEATSIPEKLDKTTEPELQTEPKLPSPKQKSDSDALF